MPDITGATATLTLAIPPLFVAPQRIQGFAPDDAYNVVQIESVETMMGVDGVLSAGFVFKPIEQEIMLQADSESNRIFDVWWTQMVVAKTTYQANGVLALPAVGVKFILTGGYLTSYTAAPQAKKLLQPRRFRVTWNMIAPAPG